MLTMPIVRPSTVRMASLIMRDLRPDDILAIAEDMHERLPEMTLTLAALIPASLDLWGQTLFTGTVNSPELMEDFWAQHGLTREVARNPDARIEIIDTGFEGTGGRALSAATNALFGPRANLLATGRLAVRLVDASPKSCGLPRRR